MRLWHRIEETFPSVCGPHSVWTVGRVTLDPGAPSIIPGRAELLFQFRDADPATLDRMHAHLEQLVRQADAAGPCAARLEILGQSRPAVMDQKVQQALEDAAQEIAPGRHVRVPSGAGHDAQFIAPHLPTGMLFVPSIGGISHHWSENTSDEDIVLGARTYIAAAVRLLAS
jgi:N-carbamoyl-L-amino-acid hydrolase